MPKRYGFQPSKFALGSRVSYKAGWLGPLHGKLVFGPEMLSAHVPLLPGEPDQQVWCIHWDGSLVPHTSWYPETALELLDA